MKVFADSVADYAQAGWPCIVPVPVADKFPPPVGFTGEHGRGTDPLQLVAWAGTHADWSIAIRMPDGVIGVDVDHYEKGKVHKRGNDSLLELEQRWGKLPATWSSTARGDQTPGPSRIMFFRCPPGRYATKLGDSIEIIQRHHRYAVVGPSWHHDVNAPYRWYDPAGQPADSVPKPIELPELPEAWIAGLREGASETGPAAADIGSGQSFLHLLMRDERPECADVASARRQGLTELAAAESGSRHDTATGRVHHLVMLGAAGHPGAACALLELRSLWELLTASEGREDEYDRMMLTSARKGVTVVGVRPVDRDPCLLSAGELWPTPASAGDEFDPRAAPEPPRWWPVREMIGAHEFDPRADLDQTISAAVLERMAPALRYAVDSGSWLLRGPDRWEVRGDLTKWAVHELAGLMPRGNPDAEKGSDDRRRADRRKKLMSTAGRNAIGASMAAATAAGTHPCSLELSRLDAEPHVLWAGGQAWDLSASTETLTLAGYDPGTPHLHSAAIGPADVPAPRWDAFLASVWPDPEVRAWALRVLSVAFTGEPDAALPILLGPQRRGKSQVISLLMSILGTYGLAADPRLLASADNSHASIVYALMGRRLAFIDEGPREGRWAQERLKQLTGGTPLTGNRMRENPVTFEPTHTLVLTANTEPTLTDAAIRARVRLIPCEGDEVSVREARAAIGSTRGPIWRAEAPGVLAFMIREAGRWLADRNSALTTHAPASIRTRADDLAKEQDPVRTWMEEETERHEEGTQGGELYTAFVRWCRERNTHNAAIPTTTAWGRSLNDLGFPATHTRTGSRRSLRVRRADGWAPFFPTPGVTGLVTGGDGSAAPTGHTGNRRSDTESVTPVTGVTSSLGTSTTTSINIKNKNIQVIGRFPQTDHNEGEISPVLAAQTTCDGSDGTSHNPSPKASAKRRQASTPEDKTQKAAEARLAKITEAAGERAALPAMVDRAGDVMALPLDQAIMVVQFACAQAGALTVDVETTGYPVGHADYALRTIQLGGPDVAVVFGADDTYQSLAARELIAQAPRLQAHSATADLVPLVHAGLADESIWGRMYDTVIPAKLADPQSTGSDPGLKQLAPAVLGEGAVIPAADAARAALFKAGKWLTDTKADTTLERSGWAQVDSDCATMIRYAAGDVLDTAAVAEKLPQLPVEVIERERAVQRITARVTHRGLPIDGFRVERLTAEHTQARELAGARVRAFGIENPGSDHQVGLKLTELRVPLPRTQPSTRHPEGQPSVAAAALAPLRGTSGPAGELVDAVLDYRHHDTVLGTFLGPYRELVQRGDGRARPTIYTLGTDTGRMCIPVDHGLVTPDGPVSADQVTPGMTTMDADGLWVTVLDVHHYADAPVETLSNRGIELAGTPEHRWVTTRDHEATYAKRTGRPIPLRALRPLSDHPRLRVHLAPDVDPFDFDTRVIPAETDGQRFAALVGMLVTDGRCADSSVPEVGVRAYVYQTESKFLAEFRRVIPTDALMYDRITANGDKHHELRIRARWLRPRLEAAGLAVGGLLKDSADLHRWVACLPLDELRAFFAACWLAGGSLGHKSLSCGSANLRQALTLAAYRLGVVAYTVNYGMSEWSTKDRLGLVFREPVVTSRKSVRGVSRSDVWCVTTQTGTFTAVNPRGMIYLTGNSCVRPNLQQLPREGGVRACITADPGHLLISADFSSVEVRVMAALSQDPNLMKILAEGADLHAIVAAQAFGPDWTKADRYTAKRGVFGWAYGGSVPSLARQIGVSESTMAAVVDSLGLVAPRYVQWADETKKAVRRGATQMPTYAGRVIHLDKKLPHKAPNYCLGLDTPVLRSDLQHVAASAIRVGDRLVAFDEHPQDGTGGQNRYHHLRTAVVEAVSTVVKPSVRVHAADGKVTECSTDHLWLVRPFKGRKNNRPRVRWVRADALQAGDDLLSLGTWGVADGRTAGYLAGLYDGEGSLTRHRNGRRRNQLFFSQTLGAVMRAFCSGMEELGLPYSYYSRSPNSTSPTDTAAVSGLRDVLRTLGTLQPARFQSRFEEVYEGNAVTAGLTESVPVVAVEYAAEVELASIQTTTRTLVANGYLSHNCVQGTARELLVDSLLKWGETRWGNSIVLPVHDEIVAMVPEAEAEEATAALVACMTTELYGVPIVAQADTPAFSWQDAV